MGGHVNYPLSSCRAPSASWHCGGVRLRQSSCEAWCFGGASCFPDTWATNAARSTVIITNHTHKHVDVQKNVSETSLRGPRHTPKTPPKRPRNDPEKPRKSAKSPEPAPETSPATSTKKKTNQSSNINAEKAALLSDSFLLSFPSACSKDSVTLT